MVKKATPEVQSGVGNDKVCVSVSIKRTVDGKEKMYWCFLKPFLRRMNGLQASIFPNGCYLLLMRRFVTLFKIKKK